MCMVLIPSPTSKDPTQKTCSEYITVGPNAKVVFKGREGIGEPYFGQPAIVPPVPELCGACVVEGSSRERRIPSYHAPQG